MFQKNPFTMLISMLVVIFFSGMATAGYPGWYDISYNGSSCQEDTDTSRCDYHGGGILNKSTTSSAAVYCPVNFIWIQKDVHGQEYTYDIGISNLLEQAYLYLYVLDNDTSSNFSCRVKTTDGNANFVQDAYSYEYSVSSVEGTSGTGYQFLYWNLLSEFNYDQKEFIMLDCDIPPDFSQIAGYLLRMRPEPEE